MNPSDDKRLFLDMQEHPERYADRELEAMMDRLDREADTAAAWERFQARHGAAGENGKTRRRSTAFPMLRRIAAVVLFTFLCGVLGYASYRAFTLTRHRAEAGIGTTGQKTPHDKAGAAAPDSLFRFANVQLDSILSMVGRHYGRQVIFRDNRARALRLHTTWNSSRPLAEFVEMLNEFDVFRLTDERDTLFVESITSEEGK